jgi:hypothetical protein
MNTTPASSNSAAASPEKRSYKPPKLTRFGDVRMLTQSGSGNAQENVAQVGPPIFCTGDKNKRPCF